MEIQKNNVKHRRFATSLKRRNLDNSQYYDKNHSFVDYQSDKSPVYYSPQKHHKQKYFADFSSLIDMWDDKGINQNDQDLLNLDVTIKTIKVHTKKVKFIQDYLKEIQNMTSDKLTRIISHELNQKLADDDKIWILTLNIEKMDFSLSEFLRKAIKDKNQIIGYEILIKLYQNIKESIDYLHEKGIFHGNIKLNNILYCKKDDKFKLSDTALRFFIGYDSSNPEDLIKFYDTLEYAHPTYRKQLSINLSLGKEAPVCPKEYDYFSLGIVLMKLGLKELPNNLTEYMSKFKGKYENLIQSFSGFYPIRLVRFVENLLKYDKEYKKKILSSRFSKIDKDKISKILPITVEIKAKSKSPDENSTIPIKKPSNKLLKKDTIKYHTLEIDSNSKETLKFLAEKNGHKEKILMLESNLANFIIRNVPNHQNYGNKNIFLKEIMTNLKKEHNEMVKIIQTVQQIKSQNIINLSYDIYVQTNPLSKNGTIFHLLIYMEQYDLNLNDLITSYQNKEDTFGSVDLCKFIDVMLRNINLIYDLGLSHGNINLNNVLYRNKADSVFVLSDIGLLKYHDIKKLKPENTLFYAPELLEKMFNNNNHNYNDFNNIDLVKCDIYSLGLILLALMAFPYLNLNEYNHLTQKKFIFDARIMAAKAYSNVWHYYETFLDAVLMDNPKKRFNAKQLLNSDAIKYFKNPPKELVNERYVIGKKIGRIVFECFDTNPNQKSPKLVIKIIKGLTEQKAIALMSKLTFLKGVTQKHLYLLQIHDFFVKMYDQKTLGDIYIIMEYMENNLCQELMKSKASLTPIFNQKILSKAYIQLSSALKSLTAEVISHGDIKPSNIFMNTNKTIFKLGDIGIRSIIGFENSSHDSSSIEQTIKYCSPDARNSIDNNEYQVLANSENDNFALSMIFLEMISPANFQGLNDLSYLKQDTKEFNTKKKMMLDMISKLIGSQFSFTIAQSTFMDQYLREDILEDDIEIIKKFE